MRPDLRKVDKPVDLAKQVIVRDMPFQAEAIKQRLLLHSPFAHHRESPRFIEKTESDPSRRCKRVFQHRVMGGSSSAEADTIGHGLEEETMTWTILLASTSRWMRPTFAFSTGKARSFARAKQYRPRKRSPTSWRKRRAVVVSYSRQVEWRRSYFMG